jgi:tRNA methyl transferase
VGRSNCAHTVTTAAVICAAAGDEVDIQLLDPAEGIAPGQAAVIYGGTRVVGSATILRAVPIAMSPSMRRRAPRRSPVASEAWFPRLWRVW